MNLKGRIMAILTANSDPTRRLTHEDVTALREQCDDWRTYWECGWFCVIGYKERRRIVHAHCDNQEQFYAMMHPEKAHAKLLKMMGY